MTGLELFFSAVVGTVCAVPLARSLRLYLSVRGAYYPSAYHRRQIGLSVALLVAALAAVLVLARL